MMAASGQPPAEDEAQAFTFPPPPYWFKLYGPQTTAGNASPVLLSQQPPAPRQGTFQVFDRMFNTEEPLLSTSSNQMIARRPDGSIDIKGQMLSLCSELLPLFLELVRQLVYNPSTHTAQLSAVNEALEAMQHLSNLLRPQQAAATLEYALQLEVGELRDTLSKLHAQVESVDKQLLQGGAALAEARSGQIRLEHSFTGAEKVDMGQEVQIGGPGSIHEGPETMHVDRTQEPAGQGGC